VADKRREPLSDLAILAALREGAQTFSRGVEYHLVANRGLIGFTTRAHMAELVASGQVVVTSAGFRPATPTDDPPAAA